VNRLVIFLNELSFRCENPTPVEITLRHVLSTLAAVRQVRRIRPDVLVTGPEPISGISLGDGGQSLATVLRGDLYKEEWRLVGILDQASPWDAYPGTSDPGYFEEVRFEGRAAIGMTWARKNRSTVLSFGYVPHWDRDRIEAEFLHIDAQQNINSIQVNIPNLSAPAHVETHEQMLSNYGRDISPSSLIYEGNGFFIRMFSNDHDPPHFHVLLHRDTSRTQAKCAIRTLDILAGHLPPPMRAGVIQWARTRRLQLLTNWQRCREGNRPFLLD
jgi:uncharacterized protein DUF4160